MRVSVQEKIDMGYVANEAFRTLRTNLQFCGDDVKAILLTSCTPNEGKSTVAFHLCGTLAEAGKKTVLVDADLRKSESLEQYGISLQDGAKGLSHYLSGQGKMEEIICSTDVEKLDVIFAGSSAPNPTELLGNEYFKKLMESLREDYDYVIVDMPPLGAVIDAVVVSRECDGSILVVESNAVSYKLAQSVKKQLEMSNCKILGAVLNKVRASKGGRIRVPKVLRGRG